MARRTFQLIQILFLFYAIYSVFNYSGVQQKVIPICCLLAVLGLEKLQGEEEGDFDSDTKGGNTSSKGQKKRNEKDARTDHVENLLTSQNPIVVADAVQYLLHDLGLFVSMAPKSKIISRVVQGGVEDTPMGIIVLQDISKITSTWKEWDAIAQYAASQVSGYRTLIIWSNCFKSNSGEIRSRKFPDNVKKLLISKNIVAMGTDTFHALYDLCSSGKIEIRSVLHKISIRTGGVITLKK